jgi:hypothetical protein
MKAQHLLGVLAALGLGAAIAAAQLPSRNSDETHNLGFLGAKGTVLTRKECPALGKGAAGIRIEKLLEVSPARGAGLSVGDVVLAVDGRALKAKEAPVLGLVAGIEAAISRKPGAPVLTVLRGQRPVKVKIPLGVAGSHAKTCPRGCRRCWAVTAAALEYLKKAQTGDGSWGFTTGSQNGQVAVASLAGLAFLASGSTPSKGPYAPQIGKAVKFVTRACKGPGRFPGAGAGAKGNWNQENWKWGFAGMFLAEAHRCSPKPDLAETLQTVCRTIARNQEQSGGWAHGPGGPNALGYLELEIVSNYVLSALGCCRQLGLEIDMECVQKALKFIEATGPGDGGVGYSTRPGQKGHGEAGRTGGAIVAFTTLGFRRHPFCQKMGRYLLRRMRDLPHGHVSPMMHLWFGSLACHNQGPAHVKRFWKEFRTVFMAARRPDGAFDSWPTRETVQLHANSDRQMGLAWSTASLALPLLLPAGKLNLLVAQGK